MERKLDQFLCFSHLTFLGESEMFAYTTHNATHHSEWRGDEGPC